MKVDTIANLDYKVSIMGIEYIESEKFMECRISGNHEVGRE